MIRLGEIQKLRVDRIKKQGAYLAPLPDADSLLSDTDGDVLLPIKQLPDNAKVGDEIEVFVYRDSKDRLICSTNFPRLTVGEFAPMRVREVSSIGAFLDMELERDLLLPFREQTYEVKAGDWILAAMYVDKSGRLAATMKIYEYLYKQSPYVIGDEAEGLIYEISRRFGAFVAVGMKYSGLIPAREFSGEVNAGDIVTVRISGVKEDGKLDCSIRKKAYLQLEDDGKNLIELIEKRGGTLNFTDKADPNLIRSECHMSKAAFKRAIGHLMKEGKVKIECGRIVLVANE